MYSESDAEGHPTLTSNQPVREISEAPKAKSK
jgi:hypothetical protein